MKQLSVYKIGGKILDDKIKLNQFIQDFSSISGPKVLVHGGGKEADKFLNKMGIKPVMKEGRRITDENTLKLITMVYGGLLNKNIVAQLQATNVNSIGLSGADLNIVKSEKRSSNPIDYGFVGDPVQLNFDASHPLVSLIDQGVVPVICALSHDGNGQLLNTNADTIAQTIASQLKSIYNVNLHFCFEKKGVIINDKKEEIINQLTNLKYQELKENGIIHSGMIPKIDNAFKALSNGVESVKIQHAEDLLLSNSGTQISAL